MGIKKQEQMKTMKLRTGQTVVAKTYANRTQAEKAQAKIAYEYGIETHIVRPGGSIPFFLALPK